MIVTPNLQLGMPFENSVADKGKGGLTWSPNGATSAGYTNARFGRGYQFASPSNWLDGGQHENPYNITQEFTIGGWVSVPWGSVVIDMGANFNTSLFAGISVQLTTSAGELTFIIVSANTSAYGASVGRWTTGLVVPDSTPTFICCTRNENEANAFVWTSAGGWQTATQAITTGAGAIIWRSNYLWTIGALRQGAAGSPTNAITSGWIDNLQVFNKELLRPDIERMRLGMHPLNG